MHNINITNFWTLDVVTLWCQHCSRHNNSCTTLCNYRTWPLSLAQLTQWIKKNIMIWGFETHDLRVWNSYFPYGQPLQRSLPRECLEVLPPVHACINRWNKRTSALKKTNAVSPCLQSFRWTVFVSVNFNHTAIPIFRTQHSTVVIILPTQTRHYKEGKSLKFIICLHCLMSPK